MGRVTYEFFRANWGSATGDPSSTGSTPYPSTSPRTLNEATWNATLLGPDIVAAIES